MKKNLDNIEKYLMVAGLEYANMKQGMKSSCPKLRGHLQNISKECSEARKNSLDTSKTMAPAKGRGKSSVAKAPSNFPTSVPVTATVEPVVDTGFVIGNSPFPPVKKKLPRGRPAGIGRRQPDPMKTIM